MDCSFQWRYVHFFYCFLVISLSLVVYIRWDCLYCHQSQIQLWNSSLSCSSFHSSSMWVRCCYIGTFIMALHIKLLYVLYGSVFHWDRRWVLNSDETEDKPKVKSFLFHLDLAIDEWLLSSSWDQSLDWDWAIAQFNITLNSPIDFVCTK